MSSSLNFLNLSVVWGLVFDIAFVIEFTRYTNSWGASDELLLQFTLLFLLLSTNIPCAVFVLSGTVFCKGVGTVDCTVIASKMTGLLLSNRWRRRSFAASLISMAFTFADSVAWRVDTEEEREFREEEWDLCEVRVVSELMKEISSGMLEVEEWYDGESGNDDRPSPLTVRVTPLLFDTVYRMSWKLSSGKRISLTVTLVLLYMST